MARQRLWANLNREPSLLEISRESGLSREEIVLAMEAGAEVESLYSAVYQDDGSEMYLVDRVVQNQGRPLLQDLADCVMETIMKRSGSWIICCFHSFWTVWRLPTES